MSFRTKKSLTIPEHVPVGAVIGKRGSYCKALFAKYRVRCSVDGDNRKVTLNGPSSGVSRAEEQLANLFESMEIGIQRVFEIAVRGGPTHSWSFQKNEEATSDKQVKQFSYRLQQFGPAVGSANLNESWVKDFREEDTANFMGYLLEEPSELPLRLKIAFGAICFKPKSFLRKSSTISWDELQSLRSRHDFATRWTNVCGRSSPSLVALMENLEEWMEKDVEPYKCLNVHLAETNESQPHVRGTYDIILDNKTSIRARASTREKNSGNTEADLLRYIDIQIPEDEDFFHTKVAVIDAAPQGVHIKGFNIQSKVYAVGSGLRFSIGYLDQSQDEFRLACRLTSDEKEKLGANDNEARILLKKMLEMLS